MAKGYLTGVDLDQGLLLPVNMREWLPANHPVWFFSDVVAGLDLTAFERGSRLGGVGRAGYSPRCLLGVLLLGYAFGQRSSRTLERLCQQDVAFRVLAQGLFPDHTTIARFRARHELAVEEVFTQVLVLCAEAGLVRLDVVAVDGTKIAASASPMVNADADGLDRRLAAAREQARLALAEAAAVDAAEDERFGDDRGDALPDDLVDQDTRVSKIRELQERLAERAEAAERVLADQQEARDRYLARIADADSPAPGGKAPYGIDPSAIAEAWLVRERELARRDQQLRRDKLEAAKDSGKSHCRVRVRPVEQYAAVKRAERRVADLQDSPPAQRPVTRRALRAAKKQRINTTDPESRAMTSSKGWVQGYNAQLAVSGDQVIVAVRVVNDPIDVHQFLPMMDKCQDAARRLAPHRPDGAETGIGVILADAGYASAANMTAPGPDRLIATSRRHKIPPGEPGESVAENATAAQTMTHRLRTEEGRALYKQRATTVEAVNGHLKTNIGLRQMARRGLQAAQAEVTLAATALNLGKLMRASIRTA